MLAASHLGSETWVSNTGVTGSQSFDGRELTSPVTMRQLVAFA
jgi:hypothetical protein